MGLIGEKYFDGGAHVQADGGDKPHLAQWLKAIQQDLIQLAGIAGFANITQANASAVAAADAVDLPTLLTLLNEEKGDYGSVKDLFNVVAPLSDALQDVDLTVTSLAATTLGDATDLATAQALANQIKARYNTAFPALNTLKAELNGAGVSIAAADVVAEASPDATNLATGQTLANSLKTNLNAAVTLINEVKADLNAVEKKTLASLALV